MARMATKLCAGAAVLALLAAGCGSDGARHFRPAGVAFSYPRAWHLARYRADASVYTAIAFVSTDRMHPPCHTFTRGFGGSGMDCGLAIRKLRPRGAYVSVFSGGLPDAGIPTRSTAKRVGVDGGMAYLTITPRGACRRYGDETITADILSTSSSGPSYGQAYLFYSCVRGPDIRGQERRVLAVLRSFRIANTGARAR